MTLIKDYQAIPLEILSQQDHAFIIIGKHMLFCIRDGSEETNPQVEREVNGGSTSRQGKEGWRNRARTGEGAVKETFTSSLT